MYLPKQGIEPGSPELQADSLPTEQSNYTPIKNNLRKIKFTCDIKKGSKQLRTQATDALSSEGQFEEMPNTVDLCDLLKHWVTFRSPSLADTSQHHSHNDLSKMHV